MIEAINNALGAYTIFKQRFPSRTDVFYAFAACVLPVFAWAVLSYLDALPGYILRFSLWDLLGMASYTLAFVLFESLVILLPVILLAVVLPPRILKDHFLARGSTLIFISSIWMMFANYQRVDLSGGKMTQYLGALVLYILSLVIAFALFERFKRIDQVMQAVMKRVAVLAYFYVALACLGVIIILIRNA